MSLAKKHGMQLQYAACSDLCKPDSWGLAPHFAIPASKKVQNTVWSLQAYSAGKHIHTPCIQSHTESYIHTLCSQKHYFRNLLQLINIAQVQKIWKFYNGHTEC